MAGHWDPSGRCHRDVGGQHLGGSFFTREGAGSCRAIVAAVDGQRAAWRFQSFTVCLFGVFSIMQWFAHFSRELVHFHCPRERPQPPTYEHHDGWGAVKPLHDDVSDDHDTHRRVGECHSAGREHPVEKAEHRRHHQTYRGRVQAWQSPTVHR